LCRAKCQIKHVVVAKMHHTILAHLWERCRL